MTPCCSERACRFGGTYRLHLQGRKVNQAINRHTPNPAIRLILLISYFAFSPILKMEANFSSESSGLLRNTRTLQFTRRYSALFLLCDELGQSTSGPLVGFSGPSEGLLLLRQWETLALLHKQRTYRALGLCQENVSSVRVWSQAVTALCGLLDCNSV
jgi:hypothetical protein